MKHFVIVSTILKSHTTLGSTSIKWPDLMDYEVQMLVTFLGSVNVEFSSHHPQPDLSEYIPSSPPTLSIKLSSVLSSGWRH